jgi:hypothetical protein
MQSDKVKKCWLRLTSKLIERYKTNKILNFDFDNRTFDSFVQ